MIIYVVFVISCLYLKILKKSTFPELTYGSKNIFRFFFSHERTSPLPHQQHAQIGPPPPPPVHHYPPSSLAGPGSTSGAPCSRQRFLPFTPSAKGGSLESETSSSTTQESPLDLSVRSSVSSTTSSALMGGAGAAIMSSLKSTLAVSMDNIQQNRPHLFGRPSGTTRQPQGRVIFSAFTKKLKAKKKLKLKEN